MSVITLSLAAGQTVSAPVAIPMSRENWIGEMGISCLLNFPAGSAGTLTLQVSNDPNASPSATPSTARWNNHDVIAALTANKNDSIVFPVAFVRLTGTVSSGTVYLDIGVPDSSNPTV